MVDKHEKEVAARRFAGAFADAASTALREATGSQWHLTVQNEPDLTKRQGSSAHFRAALDGSLQGDCFIELYESHAAELAAKVAGHAESASSKENRDVLAKLLSAAMRGLTQSLAGTYDEFTVKLNPVEGLAFGGMFMVPILATAEDGAEAPILLYFDNPLLASLSDRTSSASDPAFERPSIDPANLKLVLDVELNVSLRFGQRQMPLREVLDLASGSVVELDKQVDDPVELLLDGKVIARGEAVIVDGNYGLRITEIPQPIASHFLR
jgi:flagellar motor switch protein FliN